MSQQKPWIIYGVVLAVCHTSGGSKNAIVLDIPAPQPTILHYDIENMGREFDVDNLPEAAGVYRCDVEVHYSEGTVDGYRAPCEDDWSYSVVASACLAEFKFPWPEPIEAVV